MAKLSRDRNSSTLHPRENLLVSGTLGALNAEVITDCHGSGTVSLDLRGTFNMTVEVSGTVDGTNWILIPLKPFTGGVFVSAVVGTTAGIWRGSCAGFDRVRARVTAYTSGSATATLLASLILFDDNLRDTPVIATNTGAAGAAVTLTIASPGAGLRHYITSVTIDRIASALLTAGATPVLVTSTNIPGSLVWSFPAEAAAQGTCFTKREEYSFPIVTNAQNTATTIVCPATTSVIWRVTAGYFVAP